LVCGVGSIGERHIHNALGLGIDDIVLYRQRNLPLRSIDRTFPTYTSLEQALATRPALAIICNPTSMHLDTAIACAKAGCHLLIEKPLSDSLAQVGELEGLINAHDLRCMIAYMGRFHPCIEKVRAWIAQNRIGDIVHYRALWGDYLPDWHPYEDYRMSYAARRDLGGGPTHTLSHELDLLYSFLGQPDKTHALRNDRSQLELETEHGMDMLFHFPAGATANLHLDYFQKPPSRRLEIVGTRGKLVFDYQQSRAELFCNDEATMGEVFDLGGTFDRNDQFVAELKYFLHCVESGSEPRPNLDDGKKVVQMALSAFADGPEQVHV
jgi:predicted dehydrogenase